MVDLPDDAEIIEVEVYSPGTKILMASSDGRGFIVGQDDVLAQTRAGRQVLNLEEKVTAKFALPITGTHVAISCNSRKLLAFKLDEIPEMARGRGRLAVDQKRHRAGGHENLHAEGRPQLAVGRSQAHAGRCEAVDF